jgi:hypothetical protein
LNIMREFSNSMPGVRGATPRGLSPGARSGLAKPRNRAHIVLMLGRTNKMTGAPTEATPVALQAAEQGERSWR